MFSVSRPNDKPRWSEPAPGDTPARPQPVPANVQTLFELGAEQFIEYPAGSGVPIAFPPTSAVMGARLSYLRALAQHSRIDAGDVTAEVQADYLDIIAQITRALESMARPVRRRDKVRRLLGRWHPFKSATAGELGWLLGFLLQRQAVSRIRPRAAMAGTN